jgi:hypothetical protein
MVYDPSPLKVQVEFDNLYKTSTLNYNENIKANIFKTAWGDYAIVVLALPKGLALEKNRYMPLTVNVRVPEKKSLKQAVVMGADYQGYSIAKTSLKDDGYLEFKVPKHGAATLIILTKEFNKLPSDKKRLIKKGQ